MSIKLMSAIFETEFPPTLPDSEGNGVRSATLKVVLLAIADHANDEGESAYPGLTRLELKTGLSRQGIVSAIDSLKFNGVLSVSEERSKLNTNSYTINLGCFPCLVNHVDQHGKIVNRVTSNGQQGLPLLVNSVDLNSTLTIHETPLSKKVSISKEDLPADWLLAAGVPSEEIAKHNTTEQAEKRILDHFERAMGYNPLDWYSNKDLSALRKFLMTKTTEEIDTFAAWSKQKYSTLTPAKVRQYPRMAIDLWPQVSPVEEADPRTNRLWKGDGFVE